MAAMTQSNRRFLMLVSFAVLGGLLAFVLFGSSGLVYVSGFVIAMSIAVLF